MKDSDAICRQVRDYILKYGMIRQGDLVIAGVSGGADSVAMLHILYRLREELQFSLEILHVHHGIRGKEADRDAAFVSEMSSRMNLPFHFRSFDVPGIAAAAHTGIEETGRSVRRKAFEELSGSSRAEGAVSYALAHNKNDQAETLLFHLCRGSGIRGLAGMQPCTHPLIRPLLFLDRSQILSYLHQEGLEYVNDSTNLEDHYIRNRIRHQVLPLLEEQVHAGTVRHMAGTAQLMLEAEEYLSRQGAIVYSDCLRSSTEGISLDAGKLLEQPEILRKYAFRSAVWTLTGSRQDLRAVHLEQLLELLDGPAGRRIRLPDGLWGERQGDSLLLKQEKDQYRQDERKNDAIRTVKLPLPGRLCTPQGVLTVRILQYTGQEIPQKKYTKWFDYDRIIEPPVLRNRKSQDYLTILPDLHRKSLRRLMIDQKIPASEREQLLLVASGSRVLWLIGIRSDDELRIRRCTKQVLELDFVPDKTAGFKRGEGQ